MSTTTAPATTSEAAPPAKKPLIQRLLERHPRFRLTILIACGVLMLLGVAGAVLLLWYVVPQVWSWGTQPFTAELSWETLKVVPALLGILFLCGLAMMAVAGPGGAAIKILAWYAEAPAAELSRQVDALAAQQEAKERQLEQADPTGLVHLVTYSRMQLQAYYRMGLTQTQRSFRYSIIAMWLGFAVILIGLLYQVVPLPASWSALLDSSGGPAAKADLRVVALAGSTVIELIAALFLWVYRSSIAQLKYFYDRQMHIHNVVMCHRIAGAMKEPDATLAKIVDKVLERTWATELLAQPSGKVLSELQASQIGARA